MKHRIVLVIVAAVMAACGGGSGDEAADADASPSVVAVAEPSPSPLTAAKGCRPQRGSLELSAMGGAWVGPDGEPAAPGEICLATAAEKRFEITLKNDVNKDGFPQRHNVSIARDTTGTDPLFRGKLINFGKRTTYKVPPLEAGVYLFRCDVHPAAMTGILNVE